MHIRARINARKIVLLYFYENYFFEYTATHEQLFEDMNKMSKELDDSDTTVEAHDIQAQMKTGYYTDIDEEVAYIVRQHFAQFAPDEIDYEYIKIMAPKFNQYKTIVQEKVDSFAVSFGYKDMDLIDRVVFVLGYMERKELETPREIILNEMIELAKRYGDEASAKLINGI